MSDVLTEIVKVDPSFTKESFLKMCELEIIPNILEVRLIPHSRWRDFHRVHPVNLSVWKETRLKHRWKHQLNFRRFYPPIVEGKHRWTTGGSPVKAHRERLSLVKHRAKCRLNVKGRVLFPVIHTFFCLPVRAHFRYRLAAVRAENTNSRGAFSPVWKEFSPEVHRLIQQWIQRCTTVGSSVKRV